MSIEFDDPSNVIRVDFTRPMAREEISGPLSPPALRLHVFGVVASIEAGRSGFISDGYLHSVSIDIETATAELCDARVWVRCEGGYLVHDREVVVVATEIRAQLEPTFSGNRRTSGQVSRASRRSVIARYRSPS